MLRQAQHEGLTLSLSKGEAKAQYPAPYAVNCRRAREA
jgi:hypothetical protein